MMTKPVWRRVHEKDFATAEKLAARIEGVTINDMLARLNLSRPVVVNILDDLVVQGKFRKVKTGHRSVHYELVTKPEYRPPVQVAAPKKLDPNAPLVMTKDTKITICPVRWA